MWYFEQGTSAFSVNGLENMEEQILQNKLKNGIYELPLYA